MTCSEIFFESFNMAVGAAYDAYFKIVEKDILQGPDGENEDELRRYVANEVARWEGTPLSELGGMTPVGYLACADSLEALTGMFREGAVICDDELPGIYLDRLLSFGDAAVETLIGLCGDVSLLDGGESLFLIPLMAIQVLGKWQKTEAVEVLIRMLDYEGDVCDLLYEKIREALINIGKPAVEGMLAAIESKNPGAPQLEHLVMALSSAARGPRSEEVYRCLKNTFLRMDNKAIGAYCLGNYGDGRAIPALRGYLVKNRDNVDRETFYDIISAIKRLGGNTDDLEGEATFKGL